jgi:hypothetical protein
MSWTILRTIKQHKLDKNNKLFLLIDSKQKKNLNSKLFSFLWEIEYCSRWNVFLLIIDARNLVRTVGNNHRSLFSTTCFFFKYIMFMGIVLPVPGCKTISLYLLIQKSLVIQHNTIHERGENIPYSFFFGYSNLFL